MLKYKKHNWQYDAFLYYKVPFTNWKD